MSTSGMGLPPGPATSVAWRHSAALSPLIHCLHLDLTSLASFFFHRSPPRFAPFGGAPRMQGANIISSIQASWSLCLDTLFSATASASAHRACAPLGTHFLVGMRMVMTSSAVGMLAGITLSFACSTGARKLSTLQLGCSPSYLLWTDRKHNLHCIHLCSSRTPRGMSPSSMRVR